MKINYFKMNIKKILVLTLILIVPVYSQEERILRFAQNNFARQKYKHVINYLNSVMRSEKFNDKEILSQMYLYLGFSHYKLENEIAESRIKNALKINPDCDINKEIFNGELNAYFMNIRKEVVGSLEVKSEPDSARVYINAEYKGRTPLLIKNLYIDDYEITVMTNGYEMKSGNYQIRPDEINRFHYELNENKMYSMAFKSIPSEVDVYLNEIYQGKTPLFLDNLISKEYVLKMTYQEGFKDFSQIITIPSNDGFEITAELKKNKDYFIYSLLIPGAGQIIMKSYKHGLATVGVMAGFFAYYYKFLKNEPDWIYKDMTLAILNPHGGWGANTYLVGDELVDRTTYAIEFEKKRKEDLKINDWDNRKERIQGFGLILYCLNLLDTYFLMQKKYSEGIQGSVNLSYTLKRNYCGINIHFGI